MANFSLDKTTVLFIDVQNYVLDKSYHPDRPDFYHRIDTTVLKSLNLLLKKSRSLGIEVSYTVIENLTKDGRDRSLDYKLSGFNIGKDSYESKIPSPFEPIKDEIVFKKTSACLFHSTNAAWVYRNMGINTIICVGFLTDQCIEQTMNVGTSLGFNMLTIDKCCAANTEKQHEQALNRIIPKKRLQLSDLY